MDRNTQNLIALDKAHVWHPFTQMQAWCAEDHDPLVLVEGDGAVLRDSGGREYIDGNSSIWTNIHGHRHPKINAAIRQQLDRIAHVSFLGTTNEPAIELAARLAALFPGGELPKVFFSDDGSTAVEAALKMAIQYWQLARRPERGRLVAFENAYHGDTAGAASLGGIGAFHGRFADFQFPVDRVSSVAELEQLPSFREGEVAAVIIEPLIQGAAGMRLWPSGMLADLRRACTKTGTLLILDEVMTGFGRTGAMFACQQEKVTPDILCLAKGLTGGYLPLAATLVSGKIFDIFLGELAEQKTFYYGHSYTGNPLGCAAALASLDIFESEAVLEKLQPKIARMAGLLEPLRAHPNVAEIRQCGFIAGIELMQDPAKKISWPWTDQTGARVCLAARKHGLLTRPILDTIVLMPPLCITDAQLEAAVTALNSSIREVCGG